MLHLSFNLLSDKRSLIWKIYGVLNVPQST